MLTVNDKITSGAPFVQKPIVAAGVLFYEKMLRAVVRSSRKIMNLPVAIHPEDDDLRLHAREAPIWIGCDKRRMMAGDIGSGITRSPIAR